MHVGKVAIIYYSRSGRTREVATHIKDLLINSGIHVDVYELRCMRDYGSNYLRMALDTLLKRIVDLKGLEVNPSNYDLFIVGTPIWVGSISPPVRSYLMKSRELLKIPVACFTTSKRDRGYSLKFREFLTSLGYEVVSDVSVVDLKVDAERIARFVEIILKYLTKSIGNH